jgi:hypothetical protein
MVFACLSCLSLTAGHGIECKLLRQLAAHGRRLLCQPPVPVDFPALFNALTATKTTIILASLHWACKLHHAVSPLAHMEHVEWPRPMTTSSGVKREYPAINNGASCICKSRCGEGTLSRSIVSPIPPFAFPSSAVLANSPPLDYLWIAGQWP